MTDELRRAVFFCIVVFLVGCSDPGKGPNSMDTRNYYGAFNVIVSEVENLQFQVNAKTYVGKSNPVEDQLGSAIHAFMTNQDVKGTPLEAEAKKLADQEQVIVKIWKSRGGVKKIREASKEMQDQVERMKAMIK
jgi:hypothetical protein